MKKETPMLTSLPARPLADSSVAMRLELKLKAARFNLVRDRNIKALKEVGCGTT